jgi:hypothetical protein
MISGILRQPMAILSAIGMLSLAEDLLQWQEQFQTWIDAWQAFSRPLALFLFGWLNNILPWALPYWWTEYVTMGMIICGILVRAWFFLFGESYRQRRSNRLRENSIARNDVDIDHIKSFSLISLFFVLFVVPVVIFWPFALIFAFILISRDEGLIDYSKDLINIFVESFVWAAVLIAINYALLAHL